MSRIKISELLNKYNNWIDDDEIQFLKKGDAKSKEIQKIIEKLKPLVKEAEKKDNGKVKGLSGVDLFKIHSVGKELWERLASYALNDIDKESKGNSVLYDYLEAATKFEDLLYGLDDYYRDHTLHSLWVYLIGEYIQRELLKEIYKKPNWYLYNDICDVDENKLLYKHLVKPALKNEEGIYKKVNEKKDAIWCLMALCHDLGYSLAKLDTLNDNVKNVLHFFELPDFHHIGYSLDLEHQYNISQFLELMAMDVRIVPNENYNKSEFDNKINKLDIKKTNEEFQEVDTLTKELERELKENVLVKCYRDDSTYWRLCKAFEKKQHGILSSYLIYKILSIFADTWVRGSSEKWGLEDQEAVDNIIRGDILFAIAQHDFEFGYSNELNSLADLLILSDELEEFSRFGRQLQSREYHSTMADSTISFTPRKLKMGDDITITIKYTVDEYKNLHGFFERKANRLCKIYSLGREEKEEMKYCGIKRIRMTAKHNKEEFNFHLIRDAIQKTTKYQGYLPKTTIIDKDITEGNYNMIFRDDKLYVQNNNNEISLKEWMQNAHKRF